MKKRYILIDGNLINDLKDEKEISMLKDFFYIYSDKFNIKILTNIQLDSYEIKTPNENDEFRRYLIDNITKDSLIFNGFLKIIPDNKISFGFSLDNHCNILQDTYMVISNSKFLLNNLSSEYKLCYNMQQDIFNIVDQNVYYINSFKDVSDIVEFDHKFF